MRRQAVPVFQSLDRLEKQRQNWSCLAESPLGGWLCWRKKTKQRKPSSILLTRLLGVPCPLSDIRCDRNRIAKILTKMALGRKHGHIFGNNPSIVAREHK